MAESIELTETQRWSIVNDLTETFIETEDEFVEELLDILSPNWRDADSCSDVETHEVTVHLDREGEND